MNDQMTLFSFVSDNNVHEPGYTTEDERLVGRELTWSELCAMYIGVPVWYKYILQSFSYYELVIPEKVLIKEIPFYKNGKRIMSDRVICYHGRQQRLLIDELCVRRTYEYPGSGWFYEVNSGGRK